MEASGRKRLRNDEDEYHSSELDDSESEREKEEGASDAAAPPPAAEPEPASLSLKARKPKAANSKGIGGKGAAPAAKASSPSEWELGKKRKVAVSKFRGQVMIDIREYYEKDDGTLAPGRKGISLSRDQWARLKAFVQEIDSAVERA